MSVTALQADILAQSGAGEILLLARIVFGGTLAFMGLNHFMDLDTMTGYAEFKGLPAPRFAVVASGVMLVLGGLGIVAGVYPVVAAGALAVFLFISAVTMHDFWAQDDPEEQQNEMTSFLKNMYGTGAALAFVVLGGGEWAYALNLGLF